MMIEHPEDLKWVMLKAGWFPGRQDSTELDKLDFTLHQWGQRVMLEFGGLFLRNIGFEADIANMDFAKYKQRFDELGIPNALPVGSSDWHTDGSIWIDEEGHFYHADRHKIWLAGQETWEGFGNLVMLRSIPEEYPTWPMRVAPR